MSSTHYQNVGFLYLVASHLEIHHLSVSHIMCGVVENRALWSSCTHQNASQLPQLYKGHENTDLEGLVDVETVLLLCTYMSHFLLFYTQMLRTTLGAWVWFLDSWLLIQEWNKNPHRLQSSEETLFKANSQYRLEIQKLKSLDNYSGLL